MIQEIMIKRNKQRKKMCRRNQEILGFIAKNRLENVGKIMEDAMT